MPISLALPVPAFLPQDRATVPHKKDPTGHRLALHRKRLPTPPLKREKFITGSSLEVGGEDSVVSLPGPGSTPGPRSHMVQAAPRPPQKKRNLQ